DPPFGNQFLEVDFAAPGEGMLSTGHDKYRVFEQDLRRQVIRLSRLHQPSQIEVDSALAQVARLLSASGDLRHLKRNAGMTAAEPVNDDWQDTADDELGRADSHLAGCRIGEKFDLFYALAQIVEDNGAAFQQSPAIWCRLNSGPVAVKQAN